MSTLVRSAMWKGRRQLRALAGAAAFFAVAMGLIGFAHTKHGRPLLALLRGAPGCPVGAGKLSPEQRDAAQVKVLSPLRGAERAAARPAFGFALERTTRAEVEQWAAQKGVRCEPTKHGLALRCLAVPAAVLAEAEHDVDSLLFLFDGASHLVAVDASRAQLSPEEAAHLVEAVTGALAAKAGPPAKQDGEADPDYLTGGSLRRVGAEFRFSDYRAQVSATNLGEKMFVREQYQSIPD